MGKQASHRSLAQLLSFVRSKHLAALGEDDRFQREAAQQPPHPGSLAHQS
jgi:hypothetical protein